MLIVLHSDTAGFNKSGSGGVRVLPNRVRVGFGSSIVGFRVFVGFSVCIEK